LALRCTVYFVPAHGYQIRGFDSLLSGSLIMYKSQDTDTVLWGRSIIAVYMSLGQRRPATCAKT